jgi:hypothetical protein
MHLFRAVLLTAVSVATAGQHLVAQEKPSFAGKWTIDPATVPAPLPPGQPRPPAAPRGLGTWGLGFTTTQDANTLTVEYTQVPVKLVYNLDGSPSTNLEPGSSRNVQVSRAVWDGNKLIITTPTTFAVNGVAQEVKRVLFLDGGNLVIETTTPAGSTTRTIYKRVGTIRN